MNRQLASLLLIGTTIAVALSACSSSRPEPQLSELSLATAGYLQLQEQIHGRDFSSLRGRRIVIDPGHGGYYRGAIGPNGLTEAEVNLGVSLHLRGLLEWAGAEVWLTRTADTDFLTLSDSTLASDLAMRVSMSDSLQPDVFISVHHNSTASLDRTINETQTYYPLADDGASLDLARSIHRHLVLNLGIEPASILPGNFHVLRNATVPAVLGEPAMISHPVMAKRLSLAASQRLEAEAYFLGLLDYFSAGLPAWSGARRDTIRFGGKTAAQLLTWYFLPDGNRPSSTADAVAEASPGPDPSQTRLTLDGKPLNPALSPDARQVTWSIPANLSLQPHLLALHGRNLAGRATPPRLTLLLPMAGPVPVLEVNQVDGSPRAAVLWRGAGGGPLPSGLLRLGDDFTTHIGPAESSASWTPSQTANVQATFTPDGSSQAIPVPLTFKLRAASEQWRLPSQDEHAFVTQTGWRARFGGSSELPFLVVAENERIWFESNGVQPLIDPAPELTNLPRTVTRGAATWPVTEILPGLVGKIIVLDPTGGGIVSDGTGPLGLRGADLNLLVAQHAANLLRGAGATVHLTRNDATLVPAVEKVRFASQVGADFFLTIGRHGAAGSRTALHHPGSPTGRLWAEAAKQASFLLPEPQGGVADTCSVGPSSDYLLRHTACPALNWTFDPPQTAKVEMLQLQPGWARAEARAVLLSIAAISGHPDVFSQLIDIPRALATIASIGGHAPNTVEWVMLDGNLMWSPLPTNQTFTSADHSVELEAEQKLSGGPGLPALGQQHVLEVHTADQWQVWLLIKNEELWRPLLMLASNDRPSSRARP